MDKAKDDGLAQTDWRKRSCDAYSSTCSAVHRQPPKDAARSAHSCRSGRSRTDGAPPCDSGRAAPASLRCQRAPQLNPGPANRQSTNVDERGWKQVVSRECGARGVAIRVRLDPHPSRLPATLLQPFISKKQPSWLPGSLSLPRGAFSASCAARIDEVLDGSQCDLRKAHSICMCSRIPEIAEGSVAWVYPYQRHPRGPSDRILPHGTSQETGRIV